MPNPSGVAMQEGWGDNILPVTVPLDIAIEVKKLVEGENYDFDKARQFVEAVEKVRSRL